MAPHHIHIVGGPTLVELNIAAVRPSQLCKLLLECVNTGFALVITLGERHYDCDAPHTLGLLRAHSQRPSHRRQAEQREELTSPHGLCPQAEDRTLPHR